MKVSVIIPVYNVAPYIIQCLDSIYQQTYQNLEVILVNDCGTDNSMEIIEQYLTPEMRQVTKVVHHEKNRGLSAARNTGIEHATGKYLLFVDSDDSISLNALSLMINMAEENNLQLVLGEYYKINEEKKKYIQVDLKENLITDNETALNQYANLKWYNIACNKLLLTDFVRNNELYFKEGYIFEDELWSFMLATKVERMGVVREALYNYYARPNSIMDSNRGSRRWLKFLKLLPFIKEYIFKEKLQTHPSVSRFFLLKLIVTLGGLKKSDAFNYDIYKQIKNINYIKLIDLYKSNQISKNEYLCYLHLELPPYFDYFYYKCIELYYKYR